MTQQTTETTSPRTFEISNRASGHFLGYYRGETEAEALDEMARDAGYSDYAECQSVTGSDDDTLVIRELHGSEKWAANLKVAFG